MDHISPLSRTVSASTTQTRATVDTQKSATCKPRLSLPLKTKLKSKSPGLQWHKEYTTEGARRGRCLIIDYIFKINENGEKTRRVKAEEIGDLNVLAKLYKDGRPEDVSLRVFHLQNWPEACRFISRKFRLHDGGDVFTEKFGFQDWVTNRNARRRGGKPLLQAKSFKVSVDPWRQVSRCAVGLDYLKKYRCLHEGDTDSENPAMVTGLMGYDQNDNPTHVHNVYTQRISMYVQYHQPGIVVVPQAEVISPYHSVNQPLQYDNGNTIVIMDNSNSHSIKDTLIPARGEFESRWRRLPFMLPNQHDISSAETDEHDIGDCMRIITQDVFTAIAQCWDDLLDAAWEHVSILEDKIYEQPADESRAPELWKNQARWLVFEKLMYYHIDCVADMRKYLPDLDGDNSDAGQWLTEAPDQFQRLSVLIDEDLTKRTSNLSELMYKSVSVRDSRESLRLGASMWRLSWITFIFLPANCLIAAFGMNVKQLESMPDVSWLFIWGVPFFAVVLIMWYGLKYWFASSRDGIPSRNGIYESLFSELAEQRPDIWTRQGPREYVVPATVSSSWKWGIMVWWTRNLALDRNPRVTTPSEPVGLWTRVQRTLMRRWTPEIKLAKSSGISGSSCTNIESISGDVLPTAIKGTLDPALIVGAGQSWRTLSEDRIVRDEVAGSVSHGNIDVDAEKRHSGIMVEEGSDESKLKQMYEDDHGAGSDARSTHGDHLEQPKSFDWAATGAQANNRG